MKKIFALITALVFGYKMVGPLWGEEAEMININTASAEEL